MRRIPALALAGALLLAGGAPADAAALPVVPAPGVGPRTVTVGSVLDLSGPLSAEGIAIRNGLTLAFDEINAKGGVLGRKIRLLTEDSRYQPGLARAGAAALLDRGIFAMIGSNGTPPVSATLGMVLDRGVLHLFPFTPAHLGSAQSDRLEFALELPVATQMEVGLRALLDKRPALKVGVLYRDDAFGRAAFKGAAREMARRGEGLAAAIRFTAGGHENLSAQIAELRKAGVQLVVLGAVAQDSFSALAQAHARGWSPVFLCPSACYMPEAATLGGRAVGGLYAVGATPVPYPDSRDTRLRAWVRAYEHRFHAVASSQAFRAYLDGRLFAEALRRCGRHPTQLHFASVLEAMPAWTDPLYGGVPVDYSRRDHSGLKTGFLAQIAGGRWHTIGDRPAPHRPPARRASPR